mmetsp:Transcript_103229/g.143794  ORF Transcript_103229/g.143794 Transcript_103229/m.143794 type:complete len:226 (+) Transcript_103229:912-1589(+)
MPTKLLRDVLRTAGRVIDGHNVMQAGNLVQLGTHWAQLLEPADVAIAAVVRQHQGTSIRRGVEQGLPVREDLNPVVHFTHREWSGLCAVEPDGVVAQLSILRSVHRPLLRHGGVLMHTGKCNELEEGTRHHFQAGLDHCLEQQQVCQGNAQGSRAQPRSIVKADDVGDRVVKGPEVVHTVAQPALHQPIVGEVRLHRVVYASSILNSYAILLTESTHHHSVGHHI